MMFHPYLATEWLSIELLVTSSGDVQLYLFTILMVVFMVGFSLWVYMSDPLAELEYDNADMSDMLT